MDMLLGFVVVEAPKRVERRETERRAVIVVFVGRRGSLNMGVLMGFWWMEIRVMKEESGIQWWEAVE